MTLFDCAPIGRIKAIYGDESSHRRLADLGLIGADYTVKAKRGNALLVEFSAGSGSFSAVIDKRIAETIQVIECESNELSALRKPERRKDHRF